MINLRICLPVIFLFMLTKGLANDNDPQFSRMENDKVVKIMDSEVLQTGFRLFIRLSSDRVFSVSCSCGIIPNYNPDKTVLGIAFLSTNKPPFSRQLKQSEMKDLLSLFTDYIKDEMDKNEKNKERLRHLSEIANKYCSGSMSKADYAILDGLSPQGLVEVLALVLLKQLKEKLEQKIGIP